MRALGRGAERTVGDDGMGVDRGQPAPDSGEQLHQVMRQTLERVRGKVYNAISNIYMVEAVDDEGRPLVVELVRNVATKERNPLLGQLRMGDSVLLEKYPVNPDDQFRPGNDWRVVEITPGA